MNISLASLESPVRLEIHYYFSDNSHTMDAFVRNRCEKELLFVVQHIAHILGTDIKVESEALEEGGLKEVWSIVSNDRLISGIIISLLTIILTTQLTKDPELTELQREDLRLSIQQRSLSIQAMQAEMVKKSDTTVVLANSAKAINTDPKVVKHRSNFYSNLTSYPKVTHFTARPLSDDQNANLPTSTILKDDFDKFILTSDNLPTLVDDNAFIEIISPVLKPGRYTWRGLYNGSVIEFHMRDPEFKQSVINQHVPFKNGSVIQCVLETERKLDDLGNIKIVKYSVPVVIAMREGSQSSLTPQGKRYRAKQDAHRRQTGLFEN